MRNNSSPSKWMSNYYKKPLEIPLNNNNNGSSVNLIDYTTIKTSLQGTHLLELSPSHIILSMLPRLQGVGKKNDHKIICQKSAIEITTTTTTSTRTTPPSHRGSGQLVNRESEASKIGIGAAAVRYQ